MNKSRCSLHPAWMKTTAVFLTAMKLFLSQWNFYGHAETIPRSKVSAWLFVWITKGVRHGEKYLHKDHNETNPEGRSVEKPCATGIFAKRKRLIVSDTLVSKLSTLFGPRGEIRTPGILNPNRGIIFFLILFSPFRGFCSERSCFPELFAPLFPSVRILSMVKNVVKSKHSPKGSTFRGAFSSSRVPWL